MTADKLVKTTIRPKKRVGRGYGSGKGGHTSSRGQKGQNSRSSRPLYFEGAPMRKSLIRRMPMLRGKLRFKSHESKPYILNLKDLAGWPVKEVVSVDNLIKFGYLPKEAKVCGVKLLGDGKLEAALKIDIPTSKSVAKKLK